MAKITHRGGWVKISSLNKKDKKNYLISITMFFIGAIFWGIHLTSVDGIMGPAQDVDPTSTFFGIIRLFIVFFWGMAIYFYNKFLKTQDELFHRYSYYIGAWGSVGFVCFGMLMSIFSPYLNFVVGFYECFLAFCIGTGIGGFIFDKKYLRDEQ